MKQKTPRLYPSDPLENNDLEQISERKFNNVVSFKNSIINKKEKITYFKDKNHKNKKKKEQYESLTKNLKSFDTFVNIATTSGFITLSITGIA